MRGVTRPSLVLRLAVLGLLLGALASAPANAAAESRWTGGVDLYRSGVFTTQKSWLWCTAASIQIVRNIVRHQTDHSAASQSRYFAYMRDHNRYNIPVRDGTDPAGWTAGFRRYVDARYRLVASTSFDSALRSAVTNLRRTTLPVGITVSHGNHAWVLTGFTATADPAVTNRFTVTTVRVVGPLWGLQSRSYGYDMRPDTELTPRQLRGFFTPWHYGGVHMAWENRWVSVQPVAGATTNAAPAPKPTPKPTAKAVATAAPTTAAATTESSVSPSAEAAPAGTSSPNVVAMAAPTSPPASPRAVSQGDASSFDNSAGEWGAMLAALLVLVSVVMAMGIRAGRAAVP